MPIEAGEAPGGMSMSCPGHQRRQARALRPSRRTRAGSEPSRRAAAQGWGGTFAMPSGSSRWRLGDKMPLWCWLIVSQPATAALFRALANVTTRSDADGTGCEKAGNFWPILEELARAWTRFSLRLAPALPDVSAVNQSSRVSLRTSALR